MLKFPDGRWQGVWIWADPSTGSASAGARVTAAFQHHFEVSSVPEHVPARLAAIGRATWWINGVEVGRGPVRSNPRRSVWDDADVSSLLHVGTNSIACLITLDGAATAWSMPLPATTDLARGAVACELHLADDHVISTDTTWRATLLAGWSATPPAGIVSRGWELLDAQSLPAHWATDAAVSQQWPAARARRAFVFGSSGRPNPPSFPVGPLAGRPISRPTPADVPLQQEANQWVGSRVLVGTLVVEVSGPAGATVRFQASERLSESGNPMETTYDPSLTVTTDGTRRIVESIDIFGLSGVTAHPDPEVEVHSVVVRERLHPVTGDNSFSCSDPLLNQIYEVGRRTVSICSLDSYVDCPTREQRAWTGDSVVHQLTDLTSNDDWSLARWHPLMAASPRADGMLPMAVAGDIESNDLSIIPDWALHWVHSVWNLYRYVGDATEIAPLLSIAEGVLRWFVPFLDEHGTPIDVPGWVIIDWSSVYSDGVSATLCGLWGRALLEFAEMAQWLGDSGRAAWADGLHLRLQQGFERLWDAQRNRYVDMLSPDGQFVTASQHGQAAAIVGGLAPHHRFERLVEVMTDEDHLIHATFAHATGPAEPGSETELGGSYLSTGHPSPWWDLERDVVRAQPFFRYVIHDALAEAGRSDLIAPLLRDWQWLLDRCPTSFSETWYGGTLSHGWSSTPTRDLIQRVIGLTPDTPGFTRALVQPNLGDLQFAKATAPTPYGPIHISVTPDGVEVDSPIPARLVWNGVETLLPATRTAPPMSSH
jgi:alpha-L-rhamnosidase